MTNTTDLISRHHLFSVGVLLLVLSPNAYSAGGYWAIQGQLLNVDESAIRITKCDQANVRLRFRSRWSDGQGCIVGFSGECPWGPSWGQAVTDANGRFSETSPFFIDLGRKRDILIEYQALGGDWKSIAIRSNLSSASPHQEHENVWRFNLGEVTTQAFDCPIILQPAKDDNGVLQPIVDPNANQDPPNPSKDSGDDSDNNPNSVGSPGQIKELPCGMGPNGNRNLDLAFESTSVRHRDNQPNAPIERITWEVVIRNNGTTTFTSTGKCRTAVRLTLFIPELNAERVYEMTLSGSIPAGGSKTFKSNSGNLGEISDAASYSYNLKFEIDPENKVFETNEDNNLQPGCYTPSTGNYADSVCD
jgi:hypothetical protein